MRRRGVPERGVDRGRGAAGGRAERASSSSARAPLLEPVADSNGGDARATSSTTRSLGARAIGARRRRGDRRRGAARRTRRPPSSLDARGGAACVLLSARRSTTSSSRSRSCAAGCSSPASVATAFAIVARLRARDALRAADPAPRARRPSASRRAASTSPCVDADAATSSGSSRAPFDRMRLRLASLDQRPQRVHRQRIARAADAAVLAGGVPRAARRRGARRRRRATSSSPTMREQVDAADEARHRPARPLPPRRRAGSPSRARRIDLGAVARRSSRASSARVPPRPATRSRSTLERAGYGARRRGARAPDRRGS